MKNKQFYYLILFAIIGITTTLQGQNTKSSTTDQGSEFKPSGKVWGLVFGDYFAKFHADSLNRGNTQFANTPKDFNAFTFRRIYLGYDYQITKKFSAQLLLANENDNADAVGERTVYIKAANIRWNIVKNNDLIIGQTATPLFALMSEQVWGYRSVEKTIADMRKLGSSNDLGISWQGKINDKGNFGYNFMVANGTSQKPETDRYKKVYGELYTKFFKERFIIDIAGDYEGAAGLKSKTTIKGFIAYQTSLITAGVEVVNQTQIKATQDTTLGKKNAKNVSVIPFGVSVFVQGLIVKDILKYFARYDMYNPDTKFDADVKYSVAVPSYKENFITAGLDWMPIKNVHLMPNIWYDSYNSMKNNVKGKVKNDYDLVARVTVYYAFNK